MIDKNGKVEALIVRDHIEVIHDSYVCVQHIVTRQVQTGSSTSYYVTYTMKSVLNANNYSLIHGLEIGGRYVGT